jgi:uncharacterized repeat protein (TIGR01451 family)
MWKKLRKRAGTKAAVLTVAAAAVAGTTLLVAAPALANAANPDPDTTGTAMVNADGSVTANLSGTWSWPGQSCEGRYGEGYAVDWWGISSSATPANNFTLTDATEVTAPGTTTTGSVTSVGSIPIKANGMFFHVAQYYAGEDVNSASTCTDTGTGPTAGSTGSWSASATYPSLSDVPAQVCVNMYDEHGSEGKPSGSASDFSPSKDSDNSIQTNAFDPTAGAGYCVALQTVTPPSIAVNKQICKVTAAQCKASTNSDWVKAHEVTSGSTAVWRVTVTNNGQQTLSDVTVSDPKAAGCSGTAAASLAPGASVTEICQSSHVTMGFTNVATATGTPPAGANVTATSSAKVTVKAAPPGITTSQSLTPNDEGFVLNGQEATGKMTFSLYPPNDPTCSGTPALTQTVTVAEGVAETSNTTFIATQPGKWRWLVTYTGDSTHKKATSPCGAEFFVIHN